MTGRCAICFATDAGYLLPTLVAATQARHFAQAALAEVFIFGIGLESADQAAARTACDEAGLALVPVAPGDVGGGAMMARLHLHRLVPPGFADLLYLDADVQVLAPLDPLLARPVPPGQLRAAPDPMALRLRAGGRDGVAMAARMAAAGIPAAQRAHYFNSGVLHIARDGWEDIAAAARAALRPGPFPDQDALNIAASGRALPLSLAWNFPVFLRNAGLHRALPPAILHFMSRPKPWDGAFPPWTDQETRPYRELAHRHPTIAPRPMPPLRRWRYSIQQRLKRMHEARAWGQGPLREAVLAAAAEAAKVSGEPQLA